MISRTRTSRKDWSKGKILCWAVIVSLAFAGLWARAYYIQIISGQSLVHQAEGQYWASQRMEGERGEILDREGRLLAKSVPASSLFVNPSHIKDKAQTVDILHQILGESRQRLTQRLRTKKSFVWIARQISDRQLADLRSKHLPGVYFKEDWVRMYPQGHLAGQLLGFVGIDGDGLEGVEKSFDPILRGRSIRQRVQRDAAGHRLYSEDNARKYDGKSIHLTIDSVIQSVAEEALAEAVTTYHGTKGMCLVIEVTTGDILAWAQYPFFNPNLYARSNSSIWKNRIALDLIEPGSTLKPIVLAAALQKHVCSPRSRFYCENGQWKIGPNKVRDTHKYKTLSVAEIIRYSSNIGMSKIGIAMGAKPLYDQLLRFGFQEQPGLPVPGESRGMIRPPRHWTKIDLAAASFGQGVAITPLQLAKAYMVFANQGKMPCLRLVREEARDCRETRVLDTNIAHTILGMLRDVVEGNGTGTRARIPGIDVGGKTGTAQKSQASGGYGEKFLASFVGFLPAMQPKYCILVMVDEPYPQHYGGVVSAPVFRKVGSKLVAYRGEAPSSGTGGKGSQQVTRSSKVQSRIVKGTSSPKRQAAIPDMCGMPLRGAVEITARYGIVPSLVGQGMFVSRQHPPAGTPWNQFKASSCKLWLTTTRSQVSCQ